jgi:hypothetical protein
VECQLLKLGPYKATVIHALQPCDPASRVHFRRWFRQSLSEGEIDPQLTFCPSTNLKKSTWVQIQAAAVESQKYGTEYYISFFFTFFDNFVVIFLM